MSKRWTIALAVLGLGLSLSSGCTGTTGHLAAVSTNEVAVLDMLTDAPPRHVIGRDCIQLIVVAPTRMPNFGDAIAEALRRSGGRVLTNVRIGYEITYVPFVYGVACYVAEGDAR